MSSKELRYKLLGQFFDMGWAVLRRKNLGKIWLEVSSLFYLVRQPGLNTALVSALKSSPSTGCDFSELSLLHRQVRKTRPLAVLELGGGISTLVLAHALEQNSTLGPPGHLYSLEEGATYLEATATIIPRALQDYVTLILSSVTEFNYGDGWIGRHYDATPKLEYDMVFVDGPQLPEGEGEGTYFDADVLRLLEWQSGPFGVLIDGRGSTRRRLEQHERMVLQSRFILSRMVAQGSRDVVSGSQGREQ